MVFSLYFGGLDMELSTGFLFLLGLCVVVIGYSLRVLNGPYHWREGSWTNYPHSSR
jgi:hypothetical protein